MDDLTRGEATQDEALLAGLRRVVAAADPCPPDVLTAARAAFALRDLEGELAALVADSWAEEDLGAAAVRTAEVVDAPRLLTFAVDGGGVEVELEVVGTRPLELLGQVVGAAVRDVVVEQGGGALPVRTDALGRFEARVEPGRLRLRLRVGERVVVTSWVRV